MRVTPIKTHIIQVGENLFNVLDKYFISEKEVFPPKQDTHDKFVLKEKSIIAVSSSVVATCEGRVIPHDQADKDELIEQESQFYLPRSSNPYNVSLTITNNILNASAGIDESNSNGNFVLLPKDPQASANAIRKYLREKFGLQELGVILTDSKTTPMRWGVTGIAIAYSGFVGVKSLIGRPDLFGKPLEYTTVSVMDCLASAATLEMGESDDGMPLAVIEGARVVEFVDHNPTEEELNKIKITMEDDLYGEFLKNAPWKKGKGGKDL